MTTLRELVAAWRAQGVRCEQAFVAMNDGVCRELDAIGGYATTSPNKNGYCQQFYRHPDSAGFATTSTKAGSEDDPKHGPEPKPFQRDKSPCHPEVGDRCFELEQAWRKEAMALTETMLAIQVHVGRGDRYNEHTDLIVSMAAKLVDQETSERAKVIEWLRFASTVRVDTEATNLQQHAVSEVARETLLGAANEIERGEHLR